MSLPFTILYIPVGSISVLHFVRRLRKVTQELVKHRREKRDLQVVLQP